MDRNHGKVRYCGLLTALLKIVTIKIGSTKIILFKLSLTVGKLSNILEIILP